MAWTLINEHMVLSFPCSSYNGVVSGLTQVLDDGKKLEC